MFASKQMGGRQLKLARWLLQALHLVSYAAARCTSGVAKRCKPRISLASKDLSDDEAIYSDFAEIGMDPASQLFRLDDP
ncbi:MAG: hypothetical protein AAGG44_21200 [Planctomycetota bacterium]